MLKHELNKQDSPKLKKNFVQLYKLEGLDGTLVSDKMAYGPTDIMYP